MQLINKIIRCIMKIKKYYFGHSSAKEIAIIANNCCGADICHSYGLRFNSPTVNLQILPCDFPKFCLGYKKYLQMDIKEIPNDSSILTDEQKESMSNIYGGRLMEDLDFPFALCGDIIIAFQHYVSFNQACEMWERRKKRTFDSKVCFLFTIEGNNLRYAKEFEDIKVENWKKALLVLNEKYETVNKEITVCTVNVPSKTHFMGYKTPYKKYYEVSFDAKKWMKNILEHYKMIQEKGY